MVALIYVAIDLRGRGVTKLLPNGSLGDNPKMIFGGNSSVDNLYKLMPAMTGRFKWAVNYWYREIDSKEWVDLKCKDVKGTKIVFRENDQDDNKLIEYDRKIIKLDRGKYLKSWWNGKCASVTAIAKGPNGEIQGYGTLWHINPGDVYVMPLYADSEEISGALLTNLMKRSAQIATYSGFLVPAVADKFVMPRILRHMGFFQSDACIQMHKTSAASYYDSIDIAKVFSVHTYWPV